MRQNVSSLWGDIGRNVVKVQLIQCVTLHSIYLEER